MFFLNPQHLQIFAFEVKDDVRHRKKAGFVSVFVTQQQHNNVTFSRCLRRNKT